MLKHTLCSWKIIIIYVILSGAQIQSLNTNNLNDIINRKYNMGALIDSLSEIFDEPIKSNINQRYLKVATLNYCGIAYSPYEFYFPDYQDELEEISRIFKKLIPLYFPKFNEKTFKWKMGKIDKAFKKNRYSPMFYEDVGVYWKNFLNRKQFQQKWDQEWSKNVISFKVEWNMQEKEELKLYDFMMYHTLLIFVFKIEEFDELIKKNPFTFINKIRPLHEISFLDETSKLQKFKDGFKKADLDILFLQEYSQVLSSYFKRQREDYHMFCDPNEDSLVLLKKSAFHKIHSLEKVQNLVKEEQEKYFKWAEHLVFIGADNYLIICAHLSSSQVKNKEQIQNLKKDLSHLKTKMSGYQIILGGDINSYLAQFDNFNLYPTLPEEYTTLKKRTTTQAQFHKSEKEVKESKDKIISSLQIHKGEITFFNGKERSDNSFIPSNEHPFDHFLVTAYLTI